MKRYLSIIIVSLCLTIPSVLLAKYSRRHGVKLPILTSFKLEIIRDGKLSDNKMLVNLEIWELNDTLCILWSDVCIAPLHDRKKVFLNPRHFSSLQGSIKNVSVGPNGFSFRLDYAEGHGLTADVVGKKREGQNGYSVKASAMDFRTDVAHGKAPEIWQSTDKMIVLPYKEVFYGEK